MTVVDGPSTRYDDRSGRRPVYQRDSAARCFRYIRPQTIDAVETARAMDPVARGPFSTSMAAPATIFESAGLSCSRDELLYRRDLTKADLSIICGS